MLFPLYWSKRFEVRVPSSVTRVIRNENHYPMHYLEIENLGTFVFLLTSEQAGAINNQACVESRSIVSSCTIAPTHSQDLLEN